MLKLFKSSLNTLIVSKTPFENITNIEKTIKALEDNKIENIKNKDNANLFRQLLVKYILLLYFINKKTSEQDIIKICNTSFKKYSSPDVLLAIKKYNELLPLLIKEKNIKDNHDLITKYSLTTAQLNKLSELNPSLSLKYIYDCLIILEFPNDFVILNKISNDQFFDNTETSTIDVIVNHNKELTLQDLDNINTKTTNINLSHDIYDFIKQQKIDPQKILSLINSHIILPITNELFLKHQPNMKYKSAGNQTDKTKLDFIITKFNKILNSIDKADDSIISINEYENVDLIINNPERMTEQLRTYTDTSYINYQKPEGLFIQLDQQTTSIRKQALIDKSKNIFKPNGLNNIIDLVGFCIKSNNKTTFTQLNYKEFLKSLKHYLSGKETDNFYWIYSEKEDKNNIEVYTTKEDALVKLYENIYDTIINKKTKLLFKKIINEQRLTPTKLNSMINFEFKDFKLLQYTGLTLDKLNLTNEQKNAIKEKLKIEELPDKYINNIYGLDDHSIKLPKIKFEKKNNVLSIDASYLSNSETKNTQQNAICMHIVELRNLTDLAKHDPITFDKLMQEFATKYIGELTNGSKVCKSCGAKLFLEDLKVSGTFDDNMHFNIQGVSLMSNVNLIDYPEYKPYKNTIIRLDSYIDRIGKIMNLLYITGTGYEQRKQRTMYVKNIIDMIIYNMAYFDKQNMGARYKLAEQQYGINHALSDLFVFDLDDNVLQTTSNTNDYQKIKKINNIIIYIIIKILLSIDKSNIYDMVKSHNCDINAYKKSVKIFDGLRIKTETSTEYITKYPVLCYIIFMFACMLSRYDLYYVEGINSQDKKQKIRAIYTAIIKIVNTIIDILNSIVETYIKLKTLNEKIEINQLFNRIYNQYSSKLSTFYNDRNILKSFETEKVIVKIKVDDRIKDSKKLEEYTFTLPKCPDINRYSNIEYAKNYVQTPQVDMQKYTLLLTCKNNGYHDFIIDKDKNDIICKVCGQTFKELFNKSSNYEELNNMNQLIYIKNIAQKYCFTKENLGKRHFFEYDKNTHKRKCIYCGYSESDPISEKDLITLGKKYYEKELINESSKKEIESIKIPEIKKEIIKKFLELVPERELMLDNNTFKIYSNTYLFDHNHLGYRISPPLVIPEEKITHSFDKFFNMNVYSYTQNKITVYYNEKTNILIGYKEINNNYVKNDQLNAFNAIIKYSLAHELSNLFDDTNKTLIDIEYINVSNFIIEYLIGLSGFNNKINYDYPFRFKYYINKMEKIGKSKIEFDDLFKNWKQILHQTIKNKSTNDYFILYVLFELYEFINSIKSKEQQRIIIEMTIDYINYYFKRTKINLDNNQTILYMQKIIQYYKNDTLFLLSGQRSDKFVNVEVLKQSDSETSSDDTSLSEEDGSDFENKVNEIEEKRIEEETAMEDFDVDEDGIDEDDDDDGKVID